jgi:hypothetical protein
MNSNKDRFQCYRFWWDLAFSAFWQQYRFAWDFFEQKHANNHISDHIYPSQWQFTGKYINLNLLLITGLCESFSIWFLTIIRVFVDIFTFWDKNTKKHISDHIYPTLKQVHLKMDQSWLLPTTRLCGSYSRWFLTIIMVFTVIFNFKDKKYFKTHIRPYLHYLTTKINGKWVDIDLYIQQLDIVDHLTG